MAGMEQQSSEGTTGQRAAAWAVHAFTATGAVLALLALQAVLDGDWGECFLWLGLALFVDGVDGSLARWAQAKRFAPRIDGDTLDLVIDYLTYVFVPTLFIWRAGFVPETLALPLGALIQLAGLYVFARRDMKSEDNYFRGFPALWNLCAFYLWVCGAGPTAGTVTILVLAAASFAPVHFVHPARVRDYGVWLPLLTVLWAAATLALIWTGWSEAARAALLWVSLGTAALLIGLGLLRTFRGPRKVVALAG
jgi:phosphatidylcholine synthase